jgi:hypothetical protein
MRSVGPLLVLGFLAFASPLSAGAQTPQTRAKLVSIAGVVVDDSHDPVGSAEVGLKLGGSEPLLVRTGADGRFQFSDVALTPGSITVRRLGYRARTVTLDMMKVGAGTPLELDLETVAADVDPVVVDASGGKMQEFQDHRAQSSFGYFFDQKDIQKISPRFVSELFRKVPGASIQAAAGIGNKVKLRECTPRIWVNGVKTANAEVDDVARPSEIDGIEIYPSWAGTPPQYMDRETHACGTVVIWTRR